MRGAGAKPSAASRRPKRPKRPKRQKRPKRPKRPIRPFRPIRPKQGSFFRLVALIESVPSPTSAHWYAAPLSAPRLTESASGALGWAPAYVPGQTNSASPPLSLPLSLSPESRSTGEPGAHEYFCVREASGTGLFCEYAGSFARATLLNPVCDC